MYTNPWDPLGQAFLDYFRGKTSAELTIFSDIEEPAKTPVSHFFREPDDFSNLESTALSLCHGRVLDIGAGAGCHALALQEMWLEVVAIDISPEAVELMKSRGVKNVFCSTIFDFMNGKFDTLLMMMNGIGIVGNMDGLNKFFKHIESLSKSGTSLILDSLDLRRDFMSLEIEGREADPERGYFGETRYQIKYGKQTGPKFWWLYIDPDRLVEIADGFGWKCEGIYMEDDGQYLAHLKRD